MSTFFFNLATKKTPGKVSGRTCWRLIPTCEFFLLHLFMQVGISTIFFNQLEAYEEHVRYMKKYHQHLKQMSDRYGFRHNQLIPVLHRLLRY